MQLRAFWPCCFYKCGRPMGRRNKRYSCPSFLNSVGLLRPLKSGWPKEELIVRGPQAIEVTLPSQAAQADLRQVGPSHWTGFQLVANPQLPDVLAQGWDDLSPCSALISPDFLPAQIRAVLLPASHLAISGDCSKDRGGVRGPGNVPYSRMQVINKHRSPAKRDPDSIKQMPLW